MRNNMKMKTYGLIVVHFLNTLDILLRPSTSSSSTVQCVWLQVRIRLKINLDCGYSNYSIGHWQGSMWRGTLASHSICVTSMDPKRLGLSLAICSRWEHPDHGKRWHYVTKTKSHKSTLFLHFVRRWRWWQESRICAQMLCENTSFPWRSGWRRRTRGTGWGWAGTMTTVKSCAQTRHPVIQQTSHPQPVRQVKIHAILWNPRKTYLHTTAVDNSCNDPPGVSGHCRAAMKR